MEILPYHPDLLPEVAALYNRATQGVGLGKHLLQRGLNEMRLIGYRHAWILSLEQRECGACTSSSMG